MGKPGEVGGGGGGGVGGGWGWGGWGEVFSRRRGTILAFFAMYWWPLLASYVFSRALFLLFFVCLFKIVNSPMFYIRKTSLP